MGTMPVMAGLLVALTLGWLRPDAVAAQTPLPSVRDSLARLDGTLQVIEGDTPAVAAARTRAHGVVRELTRLSTAWPAESPDAYTRSLAALVDALAQAAAPAGAATRAAVIDALADDLEVKLGHCLASGGKLGGAVLLGVRTRDVRQEARDWQVLYLPRILALSPTATPMVFPQLSSPTEAAVVPGRYVLWARNPFTGQTGERLTVSVGGGRTALAIELPVPTATP